MRLAVRQVVSVVRFIRIGKSFFVTPELEPEDVLEALALAAKLDDPATDD
jgi:hypothetical protein